jgi:hypothetical protein
MGVTGTPTFFLNGERMNIQTYDDFRNAIEAALGVEKATSTDTDSADTNSAENTTTGAEAGASVEFGI